MPFSSAHPRNYFAVAKQSARGTEGDTFFFHKYGEGSGFEVEQEFEAEFEGGDGQAQGLVYKTFVKADPALTGNARPDLFTRMSAYVLGANTTPASVSATDVATHILTPNATVPYLTVEQAYLNGNTIDRVVDAQAKSLKITGEAGKPWYIETQFVGGGTVYGRNGSASALTASFESAQPFYYGQGAYLIDGATSLDIEKFEYLFEWEVDDNLFTVSPFRRAVQNLSYKVSVDATLIVENDDLYEKIKRGGAGATTIPVTLATGAFAAQSISTSSQMARIDVPLLYWTDAKLNRLEPDGKTVKIDVVGMGIKGATSAVQHRSNVIGIPSAIIV